MAMFGLIVSGRLVQTEFQPISETQFVTTILDADGINHIVVFLTGAVPFPEGIAGQVYFSWPDPNAPPNWQPLGYISNQKPSAIFKISTLKKLDEMGDYSNRMFGQSDIVHNAQIGVALEPFGNVREHPASSTVATNLTFAQKMLENFVNYVMSFSGAAVGGEQVVPLAAVRSWYANFERRLQQNPNFWR